MKFTLLLNLSLFAFMFSTRAQTTYVLNPFQDASIGYHRQAGSAANNYGTADHYSSFSQPGVVAGANSGMGIMEFDLAQIAPGSQVIEAHLDLYGRGPFGAGDAASVGNTGKNKSYLARITSAWDQFIVTYQTRPSYTTVDSVILPPTPQASKDYLGIDVTQLVQDMIDDPSNSHGFLLRLVTDHPTRSLAFWSTNGSDPNLWPLLTIVVADGGEKVNAETSTKEVVNYPNPFSTTTTLLIPSEYSIQQLQIEIYDVFGKIVKTMPASGAASITISRDNLPGGIYLIQLRKETKVVSTGKLVIE